MEERLRQCAPRQLPPQMRRRVLDAARTRAGRASVWDRAWESRAFWAAAAASMVIGLLLPRGYGGTAATAARARQVAPEVEALIDVIAPMTGDEKAFRERLAAQLGGGLTDGAGTGIRDYGLLLEDTVWQG